MSSDPIRTDANRIRPCSFVSDWWVGTIPGRIASLIYINFDWPERFRVQSDANEQGLSVPIRQDSSKPLIGYRMG
jgi:hypothetical protein